MEASGIFAPFNQTKMLIVSLRGSLWQEPSPYIINGHSVNKSGRFSAIACLRDKHTALLLRPCFQKLKKFLVRIQCAFLL